MTSERMNSMNTNVVERTNVNLAVRPHWLWMPCRFQLVDRLIMIACLLMTTGTTMSLALAQATDDPAVESPPAVVATQESPPNPKVDEADIEIPDAVEAPSASAEEASVDAIDAPQEGLGKAPLTVEPLSDSYKGNWPIVSEGRPDWIETVPVVKHGLHLITISSDPMLELAKAIQSRDDEIRRRVNQYVDEVLASRNAHRFLSWDMDELKSRLIREGDTYEDVAEYSVGQLHQAHAMLTIDTAFQNEIHQRWQEVVTSIRLAQTGGIAAGVLALIFVVFSYLRLDTASRGYYTGRLRMLGGLAMLGLIVFGVMFLRYNLEWVHFLLYS